MAPMPSVDGSRLLSRIRELAAIGREPDGGIIRLAWSREDRFRNSFDQASLAARNSASRNTSQRHGCLLGCAAGPTSPGRFIDTNATSLRIN